MVQARRIRLVGLGDARRPQHEAEVPVVVANVFIWPQAEARAPAKAQNIHKNRIIKAL
jgi:hypothetical protein